jgi:hypothetical protein
VCSVVPVADGLADAPAGVHLVAVRGGSLANLPKLLGIAALGFATAIGGPEQLHESRQLDRALRAHLRTPPVKGTFARPAIDLARPDFNDVFVSVFETR